MINMFELYNRLADHIEEHGGKFELSMDKETKTWIAAMTDDTAHTLCTEHGPIPALESLMKALRHD